MADSETRSRSVLWLATIGFACAASACGMLLGLDDYRVAADPDAGAGGGSGDGGSENGGASAFAQGGAAGDGLGGNGTGGSGTAGSGTAGSAGSGTPSMGGAGNGGASSGADALEPLPPLAEASCMDEDSLLVFYQDRTEGEIETADVSMLLSVESISAPAFELTELTLRYWFTDDGAFDFSTCPAGGTTCFSVDYAAYSGGVITDDVTVTFGEEFGSNYAEIGFTGSGTVPALGSITTIQVRLHGAGNPRLNQSNDFSFIADAADEGNRNITPYLGGVQVGGCVPLPP